MCHQCRLRGQRGQQGCFLHQQAAMQGGSSSIDQQARQCCPHLRQTATLRRQWLQRQRGAAVKVRMAAALSMWHGRTVWAPVLTEMPVAGGAAAAPQPTGLKVQLPAAGPAVCLHHPGNSSAAAAADSTRCSSTAAAAIFVATAARHGAPVQAAGATAAAAAIVQGVALGPGLLLVLLL